MDNFRLWILALLLCSPAAYPLSGPVVATENVKARLVSETDAIGPGQSVSVALELNIREGWHTYWRNPGDSGQATSIVWNLPAGFTASGISWPAPHRFELPPLVNYGYARHVMLLIKITAPKILPQTPAADLQAKASWLVCADVCVPEEAQLNLRLPQGAVAAPPAQDVVALFAAARGELPVAAPAPAGLKLDHGRVTLVLGAPWGATAAHIKSLEFYPYAEGSIDYAAPQILTHTATGIELAVKAGDQPPGQELRGVLVAAERNGADTATVAMEIVASATAIGKPQPGALPATPAFATLILLAVAGGLLLNLMPCVLPVLSIKAIGLAEQAKEHPADVRTKGLIFAAGVISSMLVMAVVLLALRAGGEQIGWGFQLQSPLFVTLMMYLLLGVGLNLSGVFEVGGGLAGLGDDLTRDNSHRASFFTGVLTTLVATPCTAPFMAAAVGAALTQSRAAALSIFASLGIGLSLPYVLLSMAPWTRRILPKPGAWMQTLKQVFAFPMYASAAWLLWVLAQQTSPVGLAAALAGAVLVALAGWAYQKTHTGGGAGGRLAAVTTAIVALGLAVFLPWHFAGAAAAARGTPPVAAEQDWQPWDAAHIASLNAAGHPVLVNFTASWCLTCLVNERSAFADSAVRQVFREKNVVLMKGDWTNRNPAITEALAAFGRAGVPLYLVYRAGSGGSEPLVLPQLLTAAIVRDAFADSQTAEPR